MSLTPIEARDEIQKAFNDAWQAGDPSEGINSSLYSVDYQDIAFTVPATTVPWARVQIKNNDSNQASMGESGNRLFTRTGIVTVSLFTPLGDGLKLMYKLVKIVMGLALEAPHTGTWQ